MGAIKFGIVKIFFEEFCRCRRSRWYFLFRGTDSLLRAERDLYECKARPQLQACLCLRHVTPAGEEREDEENGGGEDEAG